MAVCSYHLTLSSQEQSGWAFFPMCWLEMRLFRCWTTCCVHSLDVSSHWRMLRRVITTSPEVVELCVKAACVLHNFLRRKTIGRTSCTPIAESTDEAPATPTL
ncbi:hypothetical protein JOQ06_027364, partial [Pogonophryne albipinna]